MPNSLKQKYLEQFARLEAIGIEVFRSRDTETPYALDHVNLSKFTSWRTRVTNLLSIVLPGKSPIRKIRDAFGTRYCCRVKSEGVESV